MVASAVYCCVSSPWHATSGLQCCEDIRPVGPQSARGAAAYESGEGRTEQREPALGTEYSSQTGNSSMHEHGMAPLGESQQDRQVRLQRLNSARCEPSACCRVTLYPLSPVCTNGYRPGCVHVGELDTSYRRKPTAAAEESATRTTGTSKPECDMSGDSESAVNTPNFVRVR